MNDDQLKWKTLSSEYIFNDTWLKARKDVCQRPDGKIVAPYYVMEYMHWATALCITEDEKIIMVKQYRHALGEVCIELPGGCVDEGESYEAAIQREALEETGYQFTNCVYLGDTSPNPSTNNNLMHMFLLTGGKKIKEQQLDHNEDIEVLSFSFEEFLDLLRKNKIVQSMHVTTIFYALQHLNYLKLGK